MDFSTAYQRRKRHAEFAEAWEAALREHAFRQAQDEREEGGLAPPPLGSAERSPSPSALSLAQEGANMSLRPDGVVIRVGEGRWSRRAEEAFLLELTVSGSVRLAAKASGFSTAAVYKRWLKDRHFAAAWEAAVETGKARVQAYLVEAATRTFDPDELPIGDERDIPKVSIGEAINIAKLPSSHLPAPKAAKGFADEDCGEEAHQEYRDACERIIERLERMKAQTDAKERETGLCHSCGQPLPVGEGRAECERG